jgi:selenocysteine lyase/cysteine desulfurase
VPFEALAEEVRPQTRLVAFSLVQSQSGRVAALSDIVAAARAASARTLVDVTQAIPFVPVRDVDYMVCAAYKHLLCPRGVAFLSVAPPHWDQVPPILANWRSAARPYGSYYGGPLSLAPTAARFDVSLAWFPWLGASVSLRYLAEWHAQGLFSHVLGLTSRLADGLGLERTGSSILSVPVQDAEAAREALAQSSVRASVRAGNVRLSPHIYNTVEEASRAISVIAPFVQVAARR